MRGSAPLRSTRSSVGQPARSRGAGGATVRTPSSAASATGGTGEARMHGAPCRRALSSSTSTALYVGALSSRYDASCASSTTAAASRGTGAQAPARLPTTTGQPARASSQVLVAGQPRRMSRAVSRSAQPVDGTNTTTAPSRARVPGSPTTESTRSIRSVAGGRRTTVASGRASAPSHSSPAASSRDPPPGAGRGGAFGRARTMTDGDAACTKKDAGPAHRHDAHSASSTTSGGGPQPSHDLSGSKSMPSGVSTSASTTQPRTLRPWSGTRTRVPTRTSSVQRAGTA